MGSIDLLMICASAFVGVFLLLSLLAIVMRLIMVVFPQRAKATDAAVLAAVAAAVSAGYPGTRITNIEEIK
jgi:hypothetical protein